MDNGADDGDAMMLSMVRDTKDTDQFVYHYTTRDKALEFILHEFKIKLGLFSKMNDPREAKDWLPSLQGSIPKDLNFRQLVTWAGHNLKNTCKVLCLTRDAPNSIVNDDILSRGFARSRMWAQYADNHDGVCLVLDKQKLGDAIEKELGQKGVIFHQPVEYTNNFREMAFALHLNYQDITSRGLETYLDEHVTQHHKALFFHKNTDWESE